MIIILNGTSSSGKSSIISSLEKKLDGMYFVFGVDKFLEASMPINLNMEIPEHLQMIDSAISAFNLSLGNYSSYIDNFIVDHVLQNPNWVNEIGQGLKDKNVFFVGVTAPLNVIEMREKNRSDRKNGTARGQYEQMRQYQYDFVVDTSVLSPDQAAIEILKELKPGNALERNLDRRL